MKYAHRFRVAPGHTVNLNDVDPGFKDHHKSHKAAAEEMERDQKKLRQLGHLEAMHLQWPAPSVDLEHVRQEYHSAKGAAAPPR